ncbi:oligomeric, coiled-coil, peripheral membrane protein [Microbotryomycetes sp. JL221]|nr:oligomeric, coiled-coil, peripheral membrane protein [Microbotryomycetes sp. JL221]
MAAVNKVRVIPGLVGKSHGRKASTSSTTGQKDKDRFLGDYVNYEKMLAVRDGCAQVFDDLRGRFDQLRTCMTQVRDGAEALQEESDLTSRDLEDLQICDQDADLAHGRVVELVQAGEEMTDPGLLAQCFEELTFFDGEHRSRVHFLVERKNAMTHHVIHTMQRISVVQSDIAPLPETQRTLDQDLRTRTDNFKHLARLEGLIPAYAATVAEIVRRRHFASLLADHSGKLVDTLGMVFAPERERRLQYRQRFAGQLPWEVKGLSLLADEPESYINLDLVDRMEDLPHLDRDELITLKDELAAIQLEFALSAGVDRIQSASALCDDTLAELDNLFKPLEVVSANLSARQDSWNNHKGKDALLEQLSVTEDSNERLSRELQTERATKEEEMAKLNQLNAELSAKQERESGQLDELRQELERARSEVAKARAEREREQEAHRRSISLLETEHSRAIALVKSAEQDLVQRLDELKLQFGELQGEHNSVMGEKSKAQAIVKELQAAIESAQAAQRELSSQLVDKDRQLRDQRGEAELDRAVLEKELADARASFERLHAELNGVKERNYALENIASDLRTELGRRERTIIDTEASLTVAQSNLRDSTFEHDQLIKEARAATFSARTIAREALRLAGTRKTEANRITVILSAAHAKADASTDRSEAPLQPPAAGTAIASVPEPDYDAAELEVLLEEVREHEAEALTEAVRTKIEQLTSTIRKYIKEARTYRDKAQRSAVAATDKLAFRNFTQGDLALFLPTRNSTVPIWAAFNINFPHHFLSARGPVAEQIKTREWLVARITTIHENVVDAKVSLGATSVSRGSESDDATQAPSNNPFGLAAGTKYFLLDVEPWSSKEARRRQSGDKNRAVSSSSRAKQRSSRIISEETTTKGEGEQLHAQDVSAGDAPVPESANNSGFSAIPEELAPPSSPDERRSSPIEQNAPSGLAVSLAAARSRANSVAHVDDPFSSSNPLDTTAECPAPTSELAQIHNDGVSSRPSEADTSDVDRTGTTAAFVSSTRRKQGSAYAGSSASSSTGPRYVRSSGRIASASSTLTSAHQGGVRIPIARSGTSPSATSGQSAFPRSASSGSSILSSSARRRANLASLPGTFPTSSVHLDRSQALAEAQRFSSPTQSTFEQASIATLTTTAEIESEQTKGAASSDKNNRSSVVMEAIAGRRFASGSSLGTANDARDEIRKLLGKH